MGRSWLLTSAMAASAGLASSSSGQLLLTDGVRSVKMDERGLALGPMLVSQRPGRPLVRLENPLVHRVSAIIGGKPFGAKRTPLRSWTDWGSQTMTASWKDGPLTGKTTVHLGEAALYLSLELDAKSDGRASVSFGKGWKTVRSAEKLASGRNAVFQAVWPFSPGRVPSLDLSQQAMRKSDPAQWIILDGPTEDKVALAGLLRLVGRGVSKRPDGSLGPFGATNQRYDARVFWDADVWVFPALCLLDPERAARIPSFRLQGLDSARKWAIAQPRLARKRPTVPPLPGGPPPSGGMIRFPWEADDRGWEAGRTDSLFQEHVTGSVVLGLEKAAALGLAPWSKVQEARRGAAVWYMNRSQPSPKGRVMRNVMSPDESWIGDNDLYTNMLAERLTGQRFFLPKDQETFLTYDGDRLLGYKQAAALLSLYPLQDLRAESQNKAMLARFLGKATRSGPAMSLSLDALLEARCRNPDEAIHLWRSSWSRYTGEGRGLFSEISAEERSVFLTGAAGCLNAVLYGFAGIRLGENAVRKAEWRTPLSGGWLLSGKGRLPQDWWRLVIPRLHAGGKVYRLEVTRGRSVLTEVASPTPSRPGAARP